MIRKETLHDNYKKCSFVTNNLIFLDFVVSAHDIQVDEEKVKAIRD